MPRVRVWDPLVRLFHWSLVLSFAVAWLSANSWENLHIWAGYAAGGLVVMRVVWGFVGTPYARFSQFVRPPGTVLAYLKAILKRQRAALRRPQPGRRRHDRRPDPGDGIDSVHRLAADDGCLLGRRVDAACASLACAWPSLAGRLSPRRCRAGKLSSPGEPRRRHDLRAGSAQRRPTTSADASPRVEMGEAGVLARARLQRSHYPTRAG